MRQISSILLLVLYLAGMLRPMLPYVEYAINKKHIAATLCVNQNKPELACNGQCYLMQQIKAMAAEQESNSPVDVPPVVSVEEVLSAHIVDTFACCEQSTEQQPTYRPDVSPHLTEVHIATPKPPPQPC